MALHVDSSRGVYYQAGVALASTSAPFTMGGWYRPATSITGCLISLGTAASNNNRWSVITGAAVVMILQIRTTSTLSITNTTPFMWGEWVHVMVVDTSTTDHSLYVNGIAINDTTSKAPTAGTDLRFGADNNAAQNHPNLILGPQALWSGVALSADDVFTLYRGARPEQIRPDALTLCWGLDNPISPLPMSCGSSFNYLTPNRSFLWAHSDSPLDVRKRPIVRRFPFSSVPAAPTGRIWKLAAKGGGLVGVPRGLAG